MALFLASQGDDEVVGPNGVVRKAELVRVIAEALHSLGFSKSGACLEEESGIPSQAPEVEVFMRQILEGHWDESVSMLRKLGIIDEAIIKLASFVILEQEFFELLDDGKIMDGLKTLRAKITPLCVHDERVRELSSFIVSSSQSFLDGASSKRSKIESREKLLVKLRKLLPPTVLVPEKRLVHLVEQALVLEKDACKFHNSSLLADHQCGRDHVPTIALQILPKGLPLDDEEPEEELQATMKSLKKTLSFRAMMKSLKKTLSLQAMMKSLRKTLNLLCNR